MCEHSLGPSSHRDACDRDAKRNEVFIPEWGPVSERRHYDMSASDDLFVWLVEYRGPSPCPIYATDKGFHTCSPYDAKRFPSKVAAETWMTRPGIIGYIEPWQAVEHGFMQTPGASAF